MVVKVPNQVQALSLTAVTGLHSGNSEFYIYLIAAEVVEINCMLSTVRYNTCELTSGP